MKKLLLLASVMLIFMVMASSHVCSGEVSEKYKKDFLENANALVRESDNVVMVCVYFEKLSRDPDYLVSKKGKIICKARIVANIKGEMKIGKTVEFSYPVEDWPGWLKDFDRTVDARLHVLAVNNEVLKIDGDVIRVTPGAQADWSYDVAKDFISGLEKSLIR